MENRYKLFTKKLGLFLFVILGSVYVKAAQLTGYYTINSTVPASTTNFQNLTSAITYMTSANVRTDGGPANSAPFGVSGPVIFDFASGTGPYVEQVTIPLIPGATPTNNVVFNGNGCVIQFNPTAQATAHIIKLSGAKHVTLDSLIIRSTNTQFGWGVHFVSSADSNTVSRCLIDLTGLTTLSFNGAAGIVFSSSTTSLTSTGANGTGNTIINNTISGNPTSGNPYYGITLCMSSSATPTRNRIINNVIQNFYNYGIYMTQTNGTVIRGNTIRNPNRTSNTTLYGIYAISGSRNDTITGNRIHDPFGTAITTTNTFYGIYLIATNIVAGSPMIISNNIIYNVRNNGGQYGIYLNSAQNVFAYNNTISFDYTASTATNAYQTIAYYTINSTSANGSAFRNNVVSLTRGGTTVKVGCYVGTNGTAANYSINNNSYYLTGNGAAVGFYGSNFASLAQWKTANGNIFDQNSYQILPGFTNPTGGDFTPTEPLLNNSAAPLPAVGVDFTGASRGPQPDMGAYEFSTSFNDEASAVAIITPVAPFASGNRAIFARVRNNGNSTLNSITINWSVNGVLMTPVAYSLPINSFTVSGDIFLDSVNFVSGVKYDLAAWTSLPNGFTDPSTLNDSAYSTDNYCILSGGVYTLNSLAAPSATNFQTFTQLTSALRGGINGPVVVNVNPSSGPYNEPLLLPVIGGASVVNSVTINGNGRTLQFNNTADYALIRFDGSKHVYIDNLVVKSLNSINGWGAHFTNNADSNRLTNCTFDLTSLTSINTTGCGIVFSASTTSPTTQGNVGVGNLIQNNTINGNPGGGLWYGITHCQSTNTTAQRNRFINNTIQHFYNYGIYSVVSNRCSFIGNTIRNPNRTIFTTITGIYAINGMRGDTISNNLIESPFGNVTNSTNGFVGIQILSPNTPQTEPVLVTNNIIRNVRSSGSQRGIDVSSGSNIRFLHNTIILNDPASLATGQVTYGFAHTGTPTGSGVELRNNIIYINRPIANTNANVLLATTGTLYTINNNAYFKFGSGVNSALGSFAGAPFETLTAWRTANGGIFDANSAFSNPLFTNLGTNSIPQDGSINNIGANVLTAVPTDFTGAARTTTPDPGAYEFVPPPLDAAVEAVIPPASPFNAGPNAINVRIKNPGTTALTSLVINWSVNGVLQTPFNWTGTLASGATSTNVNIGNFTFLSALNHTITAWSSLPNGSPDPITLNDTASVTNVFTRISAGTYTLNKNVAASSTNFISFNALSLALNNGGVAGGITIDVVSGSGPYTEQVTFGNIPGASATNRIVINGNNQELNFNNTNAALLQVMGFNNAKHFTINGINFKTLNATNGVGLMFTNNSDSNIIENCNFDLTSITGTSSTVSAGISFSGGFNSVASTPVNSSGAANIIRNNTINGGSGNGCYYGIIVNATNLSNPTYSHNKILNNVITDFYFYGIYLANSTRAAIKNNQISRPTKIAPTTYYGVFLTNGSQADTIEGNLITRPYGAQLTNSATIYGIAFSSTNSQVATPSIVKNNVINDFRGAGILYGIQNSTNAHIKVLSNTINLDDAATTSTSAVYAFYSTGTATAISIRNNNINIVRGGTGLKYCIFLNTASATGYTINNNNLRSVTSGTNAFIGSYSAVNYATLLNWRTANANAFDQNSVSADPLFRNGIFANFLQPGNDTLENIGANLATDVPVDFAGNARSITPDIGAYEFATNPNDVGVLRFTQFGSSTQNTTLVNSVSQGIDLTLKNFGTSVLSSATLNWSLGGIPQTPISWSGFLAKGDTVVTSLGLYNFPDSSVYSLKSWTTLPNGVLDSVNTNDTSETRICRPLSGTLYLNPSLPDTGTNFTSFNGLFNVLRTCGVAGPVTVVLSATTINQQITMPNNIPGHSSLTPITFAGQDSATTRIVHNGSGVRPTLLLDGAKNYRFRNISFIGNNATSATAVQLINGADSNMFVKCAFNVPFVTTTTVNAFIASGNITGATTQGNAANYLVIDSCSANGGYYGIAINGLSTQKSLGNTIRNSRISNSYIYGAYIQQQKALSLTGNRVTGIGVPFNYTFAYGIYALACDSGTSISGNRISNQFGGYGIWVQNCLGLSSSRVVVSNNTIDIGSTLATNTYGIYDNTNGLIDIAYNTVRISSTDANYIYAAYYSTNATTSTYFDIRLMNNIFVSTGGALSVYFANQLNTQAALYNINNNVYHSSNLYPFRVGGFITTTLVNFATGAQMLGLITGNNTASLFLLPVFDANMRSIDPLLDGAANPLATVVSDIEGNLRNVSTPDIGAFEFTKTPNDAGVTTILSPVKPLTAGNNDIRVVIRNFGLLPLTGVDVTYQIGLTTHTVSYAGNIPTLGYDTVTFNATSGSGSTSQQYNFTGGIETIKVWTSMPNGVADIINSNDTASNTLCTGISGNFTIDPVGVGASNFTSIQAAIDKLICGGVYGHVVFNIAPGTYNGQFTIPTITGASDTSTITFKAANNIASSTIITASPTLGTANFTIRLLGTKFIRFVNLTLQNTNATNGRVVSINTDGLTNIVSSDIEIRGCIINGEPTTTTADANSLVFANTGNTTPNLTFVGNQFNNGSHGIWANGPNIVNQFSPNIVIDSNVFNNQYYSASWLTNRSTIRYRNNTINLSNTSTLAYGLYSIGSGGNSSISNNVITNPSGTYGISMTQQAYYGLSGTATISNNVINMMNASNTQYGISVTTSSQVDIFGNTVKVNSSSASSWALFLGGHAPFLSGITNYPRSNTVAIKNNILHAQGGYAFRSNDINADSAIIDAFGINHNLYFGNTANVVFARGNNYGSSNFINGYRNIYYPGSDGYSKLADLVFTSSTNLKPSESASTIWNVNGGAAPLFQVPFDIAGLSRSQTPATGTPDIGAHEVSPNAEPANAVIVGTLALDSTQTMMVNGDTVGWITWGNSGTVPTAMSVKYYPGSLISHSQNYSTGTTGHSLDALWKLNLTGGSSYYYNLRLKYNPYHLGTVPSETDIRLANKDTGASAFWIPYPFSTTILDTNANTFGINFANVSNLFTGTTDLSPLPVNLTSFHAKRNGTNAELNWVTASERNFRHFEIERSFDGGLFVAINKVAAIGSSGNGATYRFTDFGVAEKAKNGQVFYRLKMMDRNGAYVYSEVRVVRFNETTASLLVYPNPFNTALSLELTEEIRDISPVMVLDVYGKLVAQFNVKANGSNKICLAEIQLLPAGIYIIKSTINGVEYTNKVLKD